jgi:glyoxylase-like metal-dependent hydrolase (beta-lactamase superfamily II)
MDELYEVFAISYARHDRGAAENFIGGDPHNGPMPLNYYIWVLRNAERTIVVDTGFDQRGASLRGRTITRPVNEGLAALGVDPATVKDVIITHLHYDHAGNDGLFANACFHLQDAEMGFATGRCMCHPGMNHPYEVEDVVAMVRRVYEGNVRFHDGEAQPFPGVTLHHIGGHARGLQAVRVMTRRGPVLLASDTTHHYAHLTQRRVFPTVDSVADVHAGYDRLLALAPGLGHIIPGHDPLVAELFPAHAPDLAGWIVRLDAEPKSIPGA